MNEKVKYLINDLLKNYNKNNNDLHRIAKEPDNLSVLNDHAEKMAIIYREKNNG